MKSVEKASVIVRVKPAPESNEASVAYPALACVQVSSVPICPMAASVRKPLREVEPVWASTLLDAMRWLSAVPAV